MDYLDEPIPSWMDGVSLLDEEQRRRSRPIFGISEVAGRHGVGHMLTVLDNAGAPNFGAGTVTMIAGARWFELSLDDGHLTGGPVDGQHGPLTPDGRRPDRASHARATAFRVRVRGSFSRRLTPAWRRLRYVASGL